MKFHLFFTALPFLLIACSHQAVTHIPIIQVKDLTEPSLALTTTSPGSLTVSFDTLPKQVRRGNPSLHAARKLIAEANGQLQKAGLRANPELEIEFEHDNRFRDFLLTVGVSQKFPRTNKLLIEKRVSAILVQAARAEVRDAERLLLGQARKSLVQILAHREQKTLLAAQENNARQLSEFIQAAAIRGEASPLEAGTALLEATRLSNRAKQIDIKEQLALAALKPLLGMKPEDQLTLISKLSTPTMPAMNVTTYQRPDLQAARLRAQSANTATALALARDISDVEAGIFAGLGRSEDVPAGTEAEQIIGFRFKISLGSNPATPGALATATARHQRLTLTANALRQQINAEAHAYYAEMEQWQTLASQIKENLIPLADKQIAQTRTAYNQGEIPLQDVLRAQEQKLSLETAHLEAKRDFHLAQAKYLTATAQ